jgi:hypothetical protein
MKVLLTICCMFLSINSADEFEVAKSTDAPSIASVHPSSGPIGTWVAIHGTGFTADGNTIQFRGSQASFAAGSPVRSEGGTSLQFEVNTCPSYQPRCPGFYVAPGNYNVTVINTNGASNKARFVLTSH